MVAKQNTSPRDHFAFIHMLRGIAALIVVWAHLSGFWLYATGKHSALQGIWENWVTGPFRILYDGGHFAVVLFFLISGFIISHVSLRETQTAFLVKRLLRIFPPLFAAIILTWLTIKVGTRLGYTLPGISGGSVGHWFGSLFLAEGFFSPSRALNVTWTLVVEIGFYALTLLFIPLSKKSPLKSQWYMTLAWILVCLCFLNIPPLRDHGNATVVKFIGFLLIGRLIYFWHNRVFSRQDVVLHAALVTYAFCAFTEYAEPGFLLTPGKEPIVSYLLAIGVFLAMLRFAPARTRWPFNYLGNVSYSLYLLHLPIGLLTLNYLSFLGIEGSFASLIAIAITIPVAGISYQLIELPGQQLARKILNKQYKPSTYASVLTHSSKLARPFSRGHSGS